LFIIAPAISAGARVKKPDDKAPRPLNTASIIVVEDQTFVLDLLERMLKGRVAGLLGARSGEDALYNLEKTPGMAHVAIVDFHLLGMDGLKFIEKVRASKSEILRKLPVIMCTGDNDMDLYRRAARLGISSFLIKPVAVGPLVEALEGALAGRKVPVPRLNTDPLPPTPRAGKGLGLEIREVGGAPVAEEEPPAPPRDHKPIDFKT